MAFQSSVFKVDNIQIINNQGKTISLIDVFKNLVIHEDLFSPYMYGTLLITDAIGIQEIMKMYGDELLIIRFLEKGSKYILKKFSVYSISPQVQLPNENTNAYAIKFVSIEAYTNNTKKIKQTFRGNANDILLQIWDEQLKDDSEKTLNILDFDANETKKLTERELTFSSCNWSPFQTINWLISRVEADNQCDFLFYESFAGYRVDSISHLVKKPLKFAYDFMSHNVTKPEGLELINIIEHVQDHTHDSLKDMQRAMYASKIYHHNHTSKQWKIHNYSYAESFDKSKHAEEAKYTNSPMDLKYTTKYDSDVKILSNSSGLFMDNILGDQSANSSVNLTENGQGNFAKFAKQETGDVADYYQYRVSQLKQLLFGPKATFSAHGLMYFTVGDMIEINKMSSGLGVSTEPDAQLSGKYIVTAIAHKFTPTEYYIELESRKNSYKSPLPDNNQNPVQIKANEGGPDGYPSPSEGTPITSKAFTNIIQANNPK